MAEAHINEGTVEWSGDHWINYIRSSRAPAEFAESRATGNEPGLSRVSLYHTRYSGAGEGHVAIVVIAGRSELNAVYTDNRALAEFILDTIIRGKLVKFDRGFPIVDAAFARGGVVGDRPFWTIEGHGHQIVSTWLDLDPPLSVYGPAPVFGPDLDFYTLLMFANDATIQVDDVTVDGNPYQVDVWQTSIGGQRSSSVLALAETKIRHRP